MKRNALICYYLVWIWYKYCRDSRVERSPEIGRINRFLILFVLCLLPLNISALNSKSSEWELKIKVEKADIRLEPDKRSPAVAAALKGTILKSYEKEGEWFRVIIGPDKEGFVVIGYIHSNAVDIIREKTIKEPDFWEEEPEFFRGIGLSVRLSGGLNIFFGGDIDKGTRGLYDSTADFLSSEGYTLDIRTRSFHRAVDIAGDIIFNLTPHIGIGLGAGYIRGVETSVLTISREDLDGLPQVNSSPVINAVPIRLGLFFTLPIHQLFAVSFNCGAALYQTKYSYSLASNWMDMKSLYHTARAKSLGFHGGIGFEINLTPRAVFFIEGRGRYARISNLKGTAVEREWVVYDFVDSIKAKGTLYYLEDEKYPYLAVLEEEPSGYKVVRKAVFDFSGISLRAGIRFKF
ncbi:MAG: hypothetical protein KAU46_10730 [Candidatus Aminicenantes bacterium]|nr:hypothetical protein [Candidatus Aminicenantes bacterium]